MKTGRLGPAARWTSFRNVITRSRRARSTPSIRAMLATLAATTTLATAACTPSMGVPGTPGTEGAPGAPGAPRTAVRRPPSGGASPGFDTRTFPGDSVMATWKKNSPYEWVGYYLPAPCFTDTSWVGRRAALRAAKWGLAVVFIGEQDWSAATGGGARRPAADTAAAPPAAADSTAAAATAGPQCTTANLSAIRGAADAARADSSASAEGFPAGTAIFLDVERVDSVSAPLRGYVRAWVAALVQRGRYTPGIYAHALNADTLRTIQLDAYPARPAGDAVPPFWVAHPEAFTIDSGPRQSGFEYATVWQGAFDRFETWGGLTLRVDVNVAAKPSPSAPRK